MFCIIGEFFQGDIGRIRLNLIKDTKCIDHVMFKDFEGHVSLLHGCHLILIDRCYPS